MASRMLKFAAALACLVWLGMVPVASADGFQVLTENAIAVRDPTDALLISIARAGDRLVAVGAHGVILYSDNNGGSWTQAQVPTSETINSVDFATPLDGWAAGAQGVILHTTDGGVSWQRQLSDQEVLPMMVKTAADLLAANPNDDRAQHAVRRAGILSDAGDDKPFLCILAVSPQVAYVFGSYRLAVKTTDGGKTWTDWSLQVGDPVSHNIYQVTRIGQAIYLAGETGIVLRSDDQGNSFQMLTNTSGGTLFDLIGTPGNALLAFGVSGNVFRSTDKGQTWVQLSLPVTSDLTAATVLKSNKILILSEDGNVFSSVDDGLTFQHLNLNEGMALFDVIQAANGDVIFIGSAGVRRVPEAALN